MTKISPKKERFLQEYLVDLNGKQACIRTGYSKNSAEVTASRLLSDANVKLRLAELMAERVERTQIDADFVLAGIKETAERCLQRRPVLDWDYENRCMVQRKDENDNNLWMFDSSGANRAFELLGKHIGLFEKDNSQKRPLLQVAIMNE